MKFFQRNLTDPSVNTPLAHHKIFQHKIGLSLLIGLGLMGFVVPLAILNQGLDTPVAVGKFVNNSLPSVKPGGISQWESTLAFPNLSFTDPSFMVPTPNGSHFHVGERGGRIYRIPNPVAQQDHIMVEIASESPALISFCDGY